MAQLSSNEYYGMLETFDWAARARPTWDSVIRLHELQAIAQESSELTDLYEQYSLYALNMGPKPAHPANK